MFACSETDTYSEVSADAPLAAHEVDDAIKFGVVPTREIEVFVALMELRVTFVTVGVSVIAVVKL